MQNNHKNCYLCELLSSRHNTGTGTAGVLKLVDKLDLGSSAGRRMGSIPFART